MKKKQPDPRTDTEPAIGTADADLTVRSREIDTGLAQVRESNLGDRMQRILRRVAGGEGVRPACDAEGSTSYSDAYRHARRFKIIDLKTSKLIDGQRGVAGLATELLTARLLETPEKFSGPQLAVVSGIATDKVLISERAAADDGSAYMSAFEKTAARIVASGVGVELRVLVSPASPAAPKADAAIDVTPTRTE